MTDFSSSAKSWWASAAGKAEKAKRRAKYKGTGAGINLHPVKPGKKAEGSGPPQWRPSEPVSPGPEDFDSPLETPVPEPAPEPTFAPPADEFVRPEDVKVPAARTAKTPGRGGWVADMIAAVGQKIHETEYIVTGDPKLQHGSADERIWIGVGRYVEEMVDIEKYGVMILLIALVSAEMTRAGILVMDLQKQGKIGRRPPRRPPEEPAEETGPMPQMK